MSDKTLKYFDSTAQGKRSTSELQPPWGIISVHQKQTCIG